MWSSCKRFGQQEAEDYKIIVSTILLACLRQLSFNHLVGRSGYFLFSFLFVISKLTLFYRIADELVPAAAENDPTGNQTSDGMALFLYALMQRLMKHPLRHMHCYENNIAIVASCKNLQSINPLLTGPDLFSLKLDINDSFNKYPLLYAIHYSWLQSFDFIEGRSFKDTGYCYSYQNELYHVSHCVSFRKKRKRERNRS
jgi:hypothetical protein